MSKSSGHRRNFLGVAQYGFIPNYSDYLVTGQKAEDSVKAAEEIIRRDGQIVRIGKIIPDTIYPPRQHFDPNNPGIIQGVSFSTGKDALFLWRDGTMVNFCDRTCCNIHDLIAAQLECHSHEYAQANKIGLTGRTKVFAAACNRSYEYSENARMLEKVLLTLQDGIKRENAGPKGP